ncbi:MAG TPA: hypothetical protein VEW28_01190 [Candidatus Kapabacteria bacterium]|nr:hypothetical protein [Candidatus Kapabacteria bacterium]
MQIGQRIILRDTVLDSNHLHKETLTLKEANVPVTTEAGLFYCSHFLKEMYHGEIYHPDSTMTDTWYAKGVGLIRERYSKWLNGKKIDRGGMDLKSYKVN